MTDDPRGVRLLVAAMSLLASSCSLCDEPAKQSVIAGCLAAVPTPAVSPATTATFDGTVVETGPQLLEACLDGDFFGSNGKLSATESEDMLVVRVEAADGNEYIVGLIADGIAPAVAVGDVVDVLYDHHAEKFAPSRAVLEIRTAGALVGWIGLDGDVADMVTPAEFSVSLGAEICLHNDDCLSWTEHVLEADVGGSAGEVRPMEAVSLGGAFVLNGGIHQQESNSGSCDDAFVARVAIAYWVTP